MQKKSKLKIRTLVIAMLLLISGVATVEGSPVVFAATQEDKSVQQESPQASTEKFFGKAHHALESALDLFDDQQDMPSKEELAFYDYLSRTKESQQKHVDSYLDVAAEALGISDINERRNQIAALRRMISESRQRISEYKRYRISAPESTYNPLSVSKKGYDQKIEREEMRIERSETEIKAEKEKLVKELSAIGMEFTDENVDILLESITGDEFVRISIIFNNAKNFAGELERLTDESGEDLETAKKYYGVYLMLLNTIDRLQLKFMEKVDDDYFPQLDQYIEQARENIKDARVAIKQGGDAKQLKNNIYSNEVTLDAADFYKKSLNQQKYEMQKANEKIKGNILTATNTYKTAALSKDIASLISTSRRAFDSITALSVPDLRPFDNAKLKDEFSRLAREIQGNR